MQRKIHYEHDSVRLQGDIIYLLRETAARGAKVRELVELIRGRGGYGPSAAVPIIGYFAEAFHVPLIKLLPLREWLGTDADGEIDALILPEIEQTKSEWVRPSVSATP